LAFFASGRWLVSLTGEVPLCPAVCESSDGNLQGGVGDDTLVLDGGDLTLDVRALPDDWIVDVESIDITGGGDNTLTVDVAEVLRRE